MNDVENIFCKITIWTYQFFYKQAIEELDGDGSDTKELAYDYTFNTFSSAGFVSAEFETKKRIRVLALDPAAFLQFSKKDGEPYLFKFVNEKLTEKFGLYLMFQSYDNPDCVSYNNPKYNVYKYTKPFLQDLHLMIDDGEMTWEEAFDLEEAK